MAAMESDNVSNTSDEDEGQTQLTPDRDSYGRILGQETVGRIDGIETDIEPAKEDRRGRQNQQLNRQLKGRNWEPEEDIEETEGRSEELSERHDELRDGIESVETKLKGLENGTYQTAIELHEEATQLEHDPGSVRKDLEREEDNLDVRNSVVDASAVNQHKTGKSRNVNRRIQTYG